MKPFHPIQWWIHSSFELNPLWNPALFTQNTAIVLCVHVPKKFQFIFISKDELYYLLFFIIMLWCCSVSSVLIEIGQLNIYVCKVRLWTFCLHFNFSTLLTNSFESSERLLHSHRKNVLYNAAHPQCFFSRLVYYTMAEFHFISDFIQKYKWKHSPPPPPLPLPTVSAALITEHSTAAVAAATIAVITATKTATTKTKVKRHELTCISRLPHRAQVDEILL